MQWNTPTGWNPDLTIMAALAIIAKAFFIVTLLVKNIKLLL